MFRYIQKQIFLYCNLYCYGLEFGFGLSALLSVGNAEKDCIFIFFSATNTHTEIGRSKPLNLTFLQRQVPLGRRKRLADTVPARTGLPEKLPMIASFADGKCL